MPLLYILFIPFCLLLLYRKVIHIMAAVRVGDKGRAKGELFFLVLMLVVIAGLLVLMESR
ncbi:MAG: hypothetical protein JWP69_987 [Flaviaesturariibacter sp.]|nr:hypothetical protein [Flaviaesturariibacter sp.]